MQDTLYLHYGRQYLKDCYIEGSVDFIFGNSTALLEHCHVHCKSKGFITAQSRKSSQETTGYVFLRCVGGNYVPLVRNVWCLIDCWNNDSCLLGYYKIIKYKVTMRLWFKLYAARPGKEIGY